MQWGLQLIHAPAAWTRWVGAPEVVVAVLDTGIRPHPDLEGRLLPGFDFISDPDNAGDGDGRDSDPSDVGRALHGTHIAGIIAADSDNGVGVAGLDWRCRVLPIRVLGIDRGSGRDSDIADAMRWAAGLAVEGVPQNAHPAAVINLSFGGAGRSATLQQAVDDVTARGVVVVAAAGNSGRDARFDSPGGLYGILSVGAAGPDGKLAAYSNFGPLVSLLAPGGLDGDRGVLSTLSSGYGYQAGTSQAAAFVSASAALVRSLRPDLGADQVRALLSATADPAARCASPGNPASAGCGSGLLDVAAALERAATCGADCPRTPPSPEIYGGCSSMPGRPPLGLTLLLASAICALPRRKRCPRSDSSGKTSR
jgi:serine protease